VLDANARAERCSREAVHDRARPPENPIWLEKKKKERSKKEISQGDEVGHELVRRPLKQARTSLEGG